MIKFIRNLPSWLPSAIVIIAVLYLTCFPDPVPTERIPLFPGADKLVHAIMFGGVASALMFDCMRQRGTLPYSFRIAALAVAIAMGGITELIQGIDVIGRSCDIYDFIADCTGALIAFVSAPPVIRRIFAK